MAKNRDLVFSSFGLCASFGMRHSCFVTQWDVEFLSAQNNRSAHTATKKTALTNALL
jgi:hypothetical protein